MRIHIDRDRCEGHGRCYATARELFEPDELGDGRVIGDGRVAKDLADRARIAADNCPERAITIEETT